MKPFDIEREVELTLSSLDRLEKIEAPVNFVDVLTSKMIFSEDQIRWINRAKLALAAMITLAIINGALMIKSNEKKDLMLQSIAKEYNLRGNI
ncbi:hypothetical protein [Ekhidna sp.]